jgi:hypothetical protein
MFPNLNDNIKDCKFFKWREALWLPRWGIYGFPKNDEIITNIEKTALKMDKIRTMFGKSIIVTSWFRPELYNQLIGGAKKSSHITGLACDFLIEGHDSNAVREMLRKYLKDINIRMENKNTVHVHIDLKCNESMSNELRYFKP